MRAALLSLVVALLAPLGRAQEPETQASPSEPPPPVEQPSPSPDEQASPAPAEPAAPLAPEAARRIERSALLWVSTILSAERMYASSNAGFYDGLPCLKAPAECVPGFPKEQAPFLDPTYDWDAPSLGYARQLHPGLRPSTSEIERRGASTSSVRSVAFTTTPLKATGLRAFCGDTSGQLCVSPDGSTPPVRQGRCEPCRKLE